MVDFGKVFFLPAEISEKIWGPNTPPKTLWFSFALCLGVFPGFEKKAKSPWGGVGENLRAQPPAKTIRFSFALCLGGSHENSPNGFRKKKGQKSLGSSRGKSGGANPALPWVWGIPRKTPPHGFRKKNDQKFLGRSRGKSEEPNTPAKTLWFSFALGLGGSHDTSPQWISKKKMPKVLV